MKIRWLPAVMLCIFAAPTHAETYFGFQIGISSGRPPVVVAREEPKIVIVPYTRIYKVQDERFPLDADVFLMSGRWYLYRRGFWFTASSLRGTYRAIDVRQVPRAILGIPTKHWRHHPHGGPPGQTKKLATRSKSNHGHGRKKS
jgi:hypothetical protein